LVLKSVELPIQGQTIFSWNRSIWASKDPSFYALFKNVNLLYDKMHP
jgi:hypothetical protein